MAEATEGDVLKGERLLAEAVADHATDRMACDLTNYLRALHEARGMTKDQVLAAVGMFAGGAAIALCSADGDESAVRSAGLNYVHAMAEFQARRVAELVDAHKAMEEAGRVRQ